MGDVMWCLFFFLKEEALFGIRTEVGGSEEGIRGRNWVVKDGFAMYFWMVIRHSELHRA